MNLIKLYGQRAIGSAASPIETTLGPPVVAAPPITLQHSEPTIMFAVTAQLPVLPEPLRLLHGPLLATVETWSDGSVVARLPAIALYAAAESDTLALAELADEVMSFAADVSRMIASGEAIGGPLAHQWRALTAMVDVASLSQ